MVRLLRARRPNPGPEVVPNPPPSGRITLLPATLSPFPPLLPWAPHFPRTQVGPNWPPGRPHYGMVRLVRLRRPNSGPVVVPNLPSGGRITLLPATPSPFPPLLPRALHVLRTQVVPNRSSGVRGREWYDSYGSGGRIRAPKSYQTSRRVAGSPSSPPPLLPLSLPTPSSPGHPTFPGHKSYQTGRRASAVGNGTTRTAPEAESRPRSRTKPPYQAARAAARRSTSADSTDRTKSGGRRRVARVTVMSSQPSSWS